MKQKITPLWIAKNLEEIIAATAIAAMLIICSCNVFFRYLLNHAISWSDEVDICLLSWATFVGSAAAYKRNLHYGMDFLLTHVSEKWKRVLRIGITALICVTCIFFAYHSIIFTAKAVKVMPYTRLSYKYLDAAAVAGFTSMALHSLYYLIQAFVFPGKFEARYTGEEKEEKEERKQQQKDQMVGQKRGGGK